MGTGTVHQLLLGVTFALAGGVVAFAPSSYPLASTQQVVGVCRKHSRGASRLLSSVAEAPSAEAAKEATTVNIRYVILLC